MHILRTFDQKVLSAKMTSYTMQHTEGKEVIMKTLNNFLFQDRDLAHDIYLRSLHRITQVYLFLMLLVFPFYSTNCYFHILRDRRNSFCA